MEDNKLLMIPLIAKENSDAKFLKIFKWLVALLVISNLVWGSSWVIYWLTPTNSESVSQQCEGNGVNNYVGQDGDIND